MPKKASAIGLLLVVVAGTLLFFGCRRKVEGDPTAATDDRAKSTPAARVSYPAAPGSFAALTAKLRPSVVHIRSLEPVAHGVDRGSVDSTALGSGFILDTDGHIVTSHRMLGNATELAVILDSGDELKASIVGRDPRNDLAVLSISPLPGLKPVRPNRGGDVELGEWVLALGRPYPDEVVVSAGVMAATGLATEGVFADAKRPAHAGFLQTDARLSRMHAGGPLVNIAGEILGMNTLVPDEDDGISFAVPIQRIFDVLPMLQRDGYVSRAWLGIYVRPLTRDEASALHLEGKQGALVSEVVTGGPAAKAGFRSNDVILQFEGKSVDHRTLPVAAASARVGQRIPVVVWRGDSERALELIPERMPE